MDKVKTALKKALDFVKRYWYLFLATAVLVLGAFLFKKGQLDGMYKSLMRRYLNTLESSKDDLQRASDARAKEQQTQREIDAKYQETLRRLERTHDVKSEKITLEQEVAIKEILTSTNNSPEQMAEKVSQSLGLPVRHQGGTDVQ